MDLKEERREGFLVVSEMKQVWALQIEMLKVLLQVCKKNNLKIWVDGGTLLGTVRHHGYIPWDDDIDLVMMREDYDKLTQHHAHEFEYPYFLQSVYTDNGYYRGHAQLRLSNTSAILPIDIWQTFNQGLFIDIFVLDTIPDSKEELNDMYREVKRMTTAIKSVTYRGLLSKVPLKFIQSKLLIKYNGGLKTYFKETEKKIKQFSSKSNRSVGYIMLDPDYCLAKPLNKEWYTNTTYLPFEDIMVPVPSGYHEILTVLYGDYMRPVNTPSMHGNVIFDLTKPYQVKIKELRHKASILQKMRRKFLFYKK